MGLEWIQTKDYRKNQDWKVLDQCQWLYCLRSGLLWALAWAQNQHGRTAWGSVRLHVRKKERKHQGNLPDQQADQQDWDGVLQNAWRRPRHLENRSNHRTLIVLQKVLPPFSRDSRLTAINLLRPRQQKWLSHWRNRIATHWVYEPAAVTVKNTKKHHWDHWP